ncbi:hypothetical protein PFISCL1PPCAC_26819, partial [Pristionchus fissidentatus]
MMERIKDDCLQAAQYKLSKMEHFAGNRDWIENDQLLSDFHSDLHLSRGDSFHRMIRKIIIWKQDSQFRKLVKQQVVDAEEIVRAIEPAASSVNAFYSVRENKLVIHAGRINPPHYYPNFLNSINYGSMGMTIGHEITHGFDPEGSRHNENGMLRDWWEYSTREKYDQRVQCISNQYNNETDSVDGINLKLQVGENVADLGGLKVAFKAYQSFLEQNGPASRLPNYPDITNAQLFFLGFGQSMCSKEKKKHLIEQHGNDAHPPNKFRLILSTRNNREFAKAFNCPAGSKMNPIMQCDIW